MEKKLVALLVVLFAVGVLCGAFLITAVNLNHYVDLYGSVGVDLESSSIHMRIRIYDGDTLVLDQYCSGVATDLCDNMTLFKWFGDSDMQYGSLAHNLNCSWISIGNDDESLSSASTVLPGEWNRITLAVDNEGQSYLNASCTFYPDNLGPYTADCIGINCADSGDGNLVFYDTFAEVTGIDEDFTINVDFKISVSHP